MRERQFSYAIKVFEAQWDKLHDESVKPFFEQLKRDTHQIDARRRGTRQKRLGHDALLSYSVFQNAEGLRAELDRQDRGVGPRAKIGYFACHGLPNKICAVEDISRTKLKNILGERSGYDGFLFGGAILWTTTRPPSYWRLLRIADGSQDTLPGRRGSRAWSVISCFSGRYSPAVLAAGSERPLGPSGDTSRGRHGALQGLHAVGRSPLLTLLSCSGPDSINPRRA